MDTLELPNPRRWPRRWKEIRELARLAMPIAIAEAGLALMGFVDTAVVGRMGSEALGAVGLANGVFFAVSSFGMGLMMGLDPLFSQAIGAGQTVRARSLVWQGFYLAMIIGAVLALPLVYASRLLALFGVEAGQVDAVQGFLVWRAPGLPLMLAFFGSRAYLQAIGRTGALVFAAVAANVLNLVTDLYLVYGGSVLPPGETFLHRFAGLGIKGAAIASSLSVAFCWLLIVAAIRRIPAPEGSGRRRPHGADLRQAFGVGWPIGLHLAAEIGVFALAGFLAGGFGPSSISAHQIAISYGTLTFTLALGIGSAGSVRVGWAVGAGDLRQARLSGMTAFAGGLLWMCGAASLFALFPEWLAKLAGAPPDTMALVIPLLMICAVFQVSDGVQAVGAGVLRGAGDTRFTFIANLVGHYGIGLPVALSLAYGMKLGVVGIWWGLCAGLTAVAAGLFWRFQWLTLRPLARIASPSP